MLFLSGFARAGEAADESRKDLTTAGVSETPAAPANANRGGDPTTTESPTADLYQVNSTINEPIGSPTGASGPGACETDAPQSPETAKSDAKPTVESAPGTANGSPETTTPRPAKPSAQSAARSAEYAAGYDAGYRDGHKRGYRTGYETGFQAGFSAGSGAVGKHPDGASGTGPGSGSGTAESGGAGNWGGSAPNSGNSDRSSATGDGNNGSSTGFVPNAGTRIASATGGGNGFGTGSETGANTRTDSTAAFPRRRFVHGIGLELRPEYVCPTNPFLAGDNLARQPIDLSLAAHLRYSFRFQPGSRPDRIYGGAYQGIGVSYYSFENREELGSPVAFYIFQGARIARISRRLSFNYEWNFGLSFGWKPYDAQMNPANIMMGSKINAYINADFYLNVTLTRELDFSAGLSMTHFSNGNTKFPNAGLNSIGMKFGLLYCFGRADDPLVKPRRPLLAPDFPRHFSYDLVLFGSWRRKGVEVGDKQYASPNAYGVAGFNFATMYNFGYKFRAGLSLDGVYDGSANVYTEDYIVEVGGRDPGYTFYTPSIDRQIALGISGRAEFVMPYFTVGIGLGVNVLHKGGDLKSFYQMLTLKIAATRRTFVHIGYCLKDFQTPNYLMLGVGFRFNNKYPVLR
jgi:hypothetical protein